MPELSAQNDTVALNPSGSNGALTLAAQVERLVARGYPDLFGTDPNAFRSALEPLAVHLHPAHLPDASPEGGAVSFAIVISAPQAPVRDTLPLVERSGASAMEALYPIEPERFVPTDAVSLPVGHAYLLLDIDRGDATRNVTPDAALEEIQAQHRSPLTIQEGIALLTHYPEFLQPNRHVHSTEWRRAVQESP